MKVNKSLITLALSCGLLALPAVAQSSTPGTDQRTSAGSSTSDSGSKIESDVRTALQKDSQLSSANIQVQVNEKNEIELSGTVDTAAQKDRAEQVATQSAPSGYTVKNNIKVSPSSPSKSETPK